MFLLLIVRQPGGAVYWVRMIAGSAAIAVGVVLVVYSVAEIFWRRGSQRFYAAIQACAMLYVVGMGCKVAEVGPELFRFCLADIGFPLAVAMAMWRRIRRRFEVYNANHKQLYRRRIQAARAYAWVVVAAIAVSYAYEIFADMLLAMAKQNYPDAPIPIGRFDWWDIFAYTGGGLYGILLLLFCERYLRAWLPRVIAYEEDEAQAAAQARREQRAEAERRRRKRKRKRT